ncbi:hypothetical protein [Macrococcus brunensis]|uniref:hypothetical protein n=1 Tax=Macrococcus brunensis TaxID=198483 RepID=UPI001EF05CDC|nr:hypothetical protein [Macrococcus brunensis]ULG72997.1 hypothetical protein MGG12_05630 [Macrococcus brunensis]
MFIHAIMQHLNCSEQYARKLMELSDNDPEQISQNVADKKLELKHRRAVTEFKEEMAG